MKFEHIIGLEVHCELKTKSKMFSSAPVSFAQEVNSMTHEVDLSMPGTLPVLNKRAVEYAILMCHAMHMQIDELLRFDRKNYYYSDLPKGFQITQQAHPIGKNGYLNIDDQGQILRIDIARLHLEEDTAKQTHFDNYSLIDYNRAGIPLIEIVTQPNLRSAKQAILFLEKLRQILLYTGVSDAKMAEGSLRCDVNVSIRPSDTQELQTRIEIKNLNSIANVQKAIEFEVQRQIDVFNRGEQLKQETRRFDEKSQTTIPMRSKEDTIDYKYYTEMNILPIRLDHQWVMELKKQLPRFQEERERIYRQEHGLLKKDAHVLASHKDLSDFYEATIAIIPAYKMVARTLLGDVLAYLHRNDTTLSDTKITPFDLAQLMQLMQTQTISSKQAKEVLEEVFETGKTPKDIVLKKGLKQISDKDVLEKIINEVLDEHKQSIIDYRLGKTKAIGFLIGQVMKKTKGQANPQLTHEILMALLKERT